MRRDIGIGHVCLLTKTDDLSKPLSWWRRDCRCFDFRICASSSSAIVTKPGGIKAAALDGQEASVITDYIIKAETPLNHVHDDLLVLSDIGRETPRHRETGDTLTRS
ncbi:hypothetical protein Sjap_011274 [Stephania japonica]|uniref:Uncharacterized protein n=1 Tax=Stephania japonica TaxID=461633 RepID=A0AAP0JD77_9MAGN